MNLWEPGNAVFAAAFVLYLAIRVGYGLPARRQTVSVNRMDARECWLLALLAVGNLILPVVYLATGWLSLADYTIPAACRVAGACLLGPALWLFWRSHVDLGLNWSISLTMRQGHQLVQQGVYRRMRHPMYAAVWLWGVAQTLILENILAGWGTLVTFAPMYFIRVPQEEKMLAEMLGEPYETYRQSTGRLFPWS